jgi:hypothetical protein
LIGLTGFVGFLSPVIGQKQEKPSEFLLPYTKCSFSDDLKIERVDKLVSNNNTPRAVETADGKKEVSRLASYRVMIKYPHHDYYMANIRPEVSAIGKYEEDKRNVIEWFEHMVSIDKELGSMLLPKRIELNGFEIYHHNRRDFFFEELKSKTNPQGGVNSAGIAVLFSDAEKTITNIYFFNTKKPKKDPKGFDSMDEWIIARDKFFDSYTKCIVENRK